MLKEILKQLVAIWHELKPFQKGVFCAIAACMVLAMGWLFLKSSSSSFVLLFPGKNLSQIELQEACAYLEHFSIPFQTDKQRKIHVAAEQVDRIRMELAASGIPKQNQGKGFELFDTNTWIKGEKELQVLEMRALKGQLEKDLTGFEHIKSASVILDIPPQRAFSGGIKLQTKASVILTLMHGARLPLSELQAITNHLAGAVRGLEPHMIAISDTSGKLYKALDPNKEEDLFHNPQNIIEDQLEGKISDLLRKIVGEDRYHLSIQAHFDKETRDLLSLSISVALDQSFFIEKGGIKDFQNEIKRQLTAIAGSYGVPVEPTIDLIPFEKRGKLALEDKQHWSYPGLFFTAFFLLAVFAASLPLFRRYNQKGKTEEASLGSFTTRIDLSKLAEAIKNEDPAMIALMLSYLEPKKAEKMIAALDLNLQEKVFKHLSEFEKEVS